MKNLAVLFLGMACLSAPPISAIAKEKDQDAPTPQVNTFFYDGVGSGWQVQWKNNGPDPVSADAAVSAFCVKGTMSR